MNKVHSYKDFLLYDMHEGLFYIVKSKDKPESKRQIFPDEEGYLTFFRQGKKYKLKANKAAIELGTGVDITYYVAKNMLEIFKANKGDYLA